MTVSRSGAAPRTYTGSLSAPLMTLRQEGTTVLSVFSGPEHIGRGPVVSVRGFSLRDSEATAERGIYHRPELSAARAMLLEDYAAILAAGRVEPLAAYFAVPFAIATGQAPGDLSGAIPEVELISGGPERAAVLATVGACIFNCEFWFLECSQSERFCILGCAVQFPNTPIVPSMTSCPEY